MPYRATAALAAAVSALAPAVLLSVAGPARADATTDPTTLPACTDVATAYGDYTQHTLHSALSGVPRSVVAGDGWHEFTASITNITGTPVPVIAVEGSAWRETDGGTELGPYARVEVRTASGAWQPLADGSSGWAAPTENLAAHSSAAYRFRFRITPDAPADVTYGEVSVEAIFADTYKSPDATTATDCKGNSIGEGNFGITPAGATATPTASAAPTRTPTRTPTPSSTAAHTPGATASGAPATGPQLAATGAPDALPLLGGLGAAALLAGAGAVTANRRRTR
jgi:hypothetical protein